MDDWFESNTKFSTKQIAENSKSAKHSTRWNILRLQNTIDYEYTKKKQTNVPADDVDTVKFQ